MATISQNQNDYLQGLVKAGGGNGEWAKSQLNGATVEQPKQPLSAIANNTPTASDMIGSIYDKNYAAQSQKLRSLRDTQLAGLAGQEDVINQNKVAGLNQNDVMATNNWRSLKESMANAGVNGGDSVTAQIGNQTAQQQGAVEINNNASNQLKQLMAQRAAINNNASADDLALMQGLQATRDGQLLNQSNEDRSFGLQEGQLTGNYDKYAKEKQEMSANSANWFNASPEERQKLAARNQSLGSLIGAKQDGNGDWTYSNSTRTLGGQQMDQQESQRQWDNEFKGKQFDYQKASDLWERTFKEKSFDQSVKQFAQNLGVDYARMNQSQQQFVAEMAFKTKSREMENDPNSLDNQYKKAQIDALKNKPAPKTPSYDYEADPEFGKDLAHLMSNQNDASTTATLDTNAQMFIDSYGIKGYMALRKAAGL